MSCKAMIGPGSLSPLWKIPVTIICTDWIKKKGVKTVEVRKIGRHTRRGVVRC